MQNYEQKLTWGHPNSLWNTVEVVEEVLNNSEYFNELFECYFSKDEVVRLRVSNAMKRIAKASPEIIVPYLNRFIDEISLIDQASTQWTFAQIFLILEKFVTDEQKQKAKKIIQKNLENSDDWIVLNASMETLWKWAKKNDKLRNWLLPILKKLQDDERKSVAGRAKKILEKLN